MNFSALKKSSQSLTQLTQAIEKSGKKSYVDDRCWELTVDKSGNGYAVIRFLPVCAADGEDSLPWVNFFTHRFKSYSGKYLYENCPTTLNQICPVCEFNTSLWNTNLKPQKDQASLQKRKLVYVSNILVVTDPTHPENEGKVFLFKYGQKIFDKIKLAMNPPAEYPDEKPFVPFDLWTGANFKLKAATVSGQRNYDNSSFASQAPVEGTDEEVERIWKAEYPLKPFLDPSVFKPYEDIKKRLLIVVGEVANVSGSSAPAQSTPAASEPTKAPEAKRETPAPKEVSKAVATAIAPDPSTDEDMKFFEDLAGE